MRYLALLRGVNVGGKSMVSMASLRDALTSAGYEDVSTYINSGNIIFSDTRKPRTTLARDIQKVIAGSCKLDVGVVVFDATSWWKVIADAPAWWGKDKTWKHNLLVMLEPVNTDDVLQSIGELKPDIETIKAGTGVLYQSLSWDKFGRTTSGKLAGTAVYKQMTIRNYNTATKLAELLK